MSFDFHFINIWFDLPAIHKFSTSLSVGAIVFNSTQQAIHYDDVVCGVAVKIPGQQIFFAQ